MTINKTVDWWPPKVSINGNYFVYRPIRNGKRYKLCPADGSRRDVLLAYDRILSELEGSFNVRSLVEEFCATEEFKALSSRTQLDYGYYKSEVVLAFGKMSPDAIQTHHIVQWRNLLVKKRDSVVQGNRHVSFIGTVLRYAREQGYLTGTPSQGIKKLKERKRTRYVTHHEYATIYKHAMPQLQVAMELSYLCMARITDVINLKRSQLSPEGITIVQSKTGKAQLKQWSPRLQQAVNQALKLPIKENRVSIFLIHKVNGSNYQVRGIQRQFEQAKEHSVNECNFDSVSQMDIHFHDLKAKSISDQEGSLEEKKLIAGHTNVRQTMDYDRKLQQVPATFGDLAPLPK